MTNAKPLPSREMLNLLLKYDPDTGILTWRKRSPEMFEDGAQSAKWRCDRWNSRFAGKSAFSATKGDGYKHTKLMGHWVTAHRVAWKMITGEEPRNIDHINGDRADNRACNLRAASVSQNRKNSARKKNSTNPFIGVSRNGKKWSARIFSDGVGVYLGTYDTPEKAYEVRKRAETEYGFHPNHGRAAT